MSLRADAKEIFKAAGKETQPQKAVLENLSLNGNVLTVGKKEFVLGSSRVFVVGAGKASCSMAKAVEKILGKRLAGGVVVVNHGNALKLTKIRVVKASHPTPDSGSIKAGKLVLKTLDNAQKGDFVLVLLSGGASSLLELPYCSLSQLTRVYADLVTCGADIRQINVVRKHLSKLKGGHLALEVKKRGLNGASLILSDVIGNDLSSIGSGPTAFDKSTVAQSKRILRKYCGNASVEVFLRETPKKRVGFYNFIVGDNKKAVDAACVKAENLGYRVFKMKKGVVGESLVVGRAFAKKAGSLKSKTAVVGGGETCVCVTGRGKGGRAQELALYFLSRFKKFPKNLLFLAAGTDGCDGCTPAAGAFADAKVFENARRLGLDVECFLKNNDSYSFFKKTRGLFVTGPTGTNVNDVYVLLIK
ncbi:MAG: glycerate kinase [Candidatus Micrarchaeia archaeon]